MTTTRLLQNAFRQQRLVLRRSTPPPTSSVVRARPRLRAPLTCSRQYLYDDRAAPTMLRSFSSRDFHTSPSRLGKHKSSSSSNSKSSNDDGGETAAAVSSTTTASEAAAATTEGESEEILLRSLDVNNPLFRQSPLYELNLYYYSKHEIKTSATKLMQDDKPWEQVDSKNKLRRTFWTAHFECPVTSQTFTAGSLRGENFVYKDDETINNDDHNTTSTNNSNNNNDHRRRSVYYARKSVAYQAAAARALDFFRFDEEGILEPRLCQEDPLAAFSPVMATAAAEEALDEEEVEEEGIDADEPLSDKDEMEESDEDSDSEGEEEDDEEKEDNATDEEESESVDVATSKTQSIDVRDMLQTDEAVVPSPSFAFIHGTADDAEEEDDEEDSLVIMEPVADDFDDNDASRDDETETAALEELVILAPSLKRSEKTPAQFVLQSLAQQGQLGTTKTHGMQTTSLAMRLVEDPTQTVWRTMAWVENWVKKEVGLREAKTTPHKVILHGAKEENLLARAKSVLATLAQANENLGVNERVVGTQKVAYSVLEFLWQTDIAKPDADTYAIYLKCLDGPDNKTVAGKAETIVENMIHGKHSQGFLPPPPNANTFNTLIQLWAQTGGPKGRYDGVLSDFFPNRESYLALLSSESYKFVNTTETDTTAVDFVPFDTEFCEDCIERIRELHDGETELDELELLNAPLRWSGGRKTNSKVIPWTEFSRRRKKGFQNYNEESFSVQRAKGMQEWIESNPCLVFVKPDIMSYEAVIQAWCRTGTRKGLGHAEDIAKKLLEEPFDSPLYPRLQTFHPVLDLWLHSEDPDAGDHLKQWADRLLTAAQSSPSISPDARLYELALLSRLFILRSHAMRYKPLEALSISRECTSLLKEFCNAAMATYTEPEGPIFTSVWRPFFFALSAWESTAKIVSIRKRNDILPLEEIVDELRSLKTEFEILVAALLTSDITPSEPGRLSDISQEIVSNAHYVYMKYVTVLDGLVAHLRKQSLELPPSILIDVEGCVRKMGEFNELNGLNFRWKESLDDPPERTSRVYADRFDYGLDTLFAKDVAIRRSSFPWSVAKLLHRFTTTDVVHTGEIVRHCNLLNQITREWKFKTSTFEDETASILDKALPSSPHRYTPIESVRQGATTEKNTTKRAKANDRHLPMSPPEEREKKRITYKEREKKRIAKKKAGPREAEESAVNKLIRNSGETSDSPRRPLSGSRSPKPRKRIPGSKKRGASKKKMVQQ